MQMLRTLSLVLVAMYLGSLAGAMTGTLLAEPPVLEDEPVVLEAPSPGHVVFGQYISSDNCPHCAKNGGGSESHHNLKISNPDEYVYLTYMSVSYGDTDTARAGNVAPYNWAWTTSGAPISYFGDRTDSANMKSGADTSGSNYDSIFSNGGGMHSTVNDYKMSASVSPNGNVFDISIDYQYIGSGTAATNLNLYAAIVEQDCTTYTYNNMGANMLAHGYNCWMGWLTSGNTYRTSSGGTGSAFETVSPTSTSQSVTWSSVPTSLIQGGSSNAVVIGVLMSGSNVSLGGSTPHVYHAVDSTMGPKMDIGLASFSVANSAASTSYLNGDVLDLSVNVNNVGDLDYVDGGNVEFYYRDGANRVSIGSLQALPSSITTTGAGSMATYTTTFDTSTLPANAWSTTFGARLTGLTGDTRAENNELTAAMNHDRPPIVKTPQFSATSVERGDAMTVTVSADGNDYVDTIQTITFDVESRLTGTTEWSSDLISGGDTVVWEGTEYEGREYTFTTTTDMDAGTYDLRVRAVDSRAQVSEWREIIGIDAVTVTNAPPTVVAEPIPTVMCDVPTKVDLTGHILDKESDLSELTITSSSSSFLGWDASTQEVEVLFAFSDISGCPLGQNGIEVQVDDGEDYGGSLPYGTLLFNVIENGQPRWMGLPTKTVDEGGSDQLMLYPYVTDTDDEGNSVSSSGLTLSIVSNSNPDVFSVSLVDGILAYAAVDDDVNGQTTVTIRASDGEQSADQTILLKILPINDAPRMDLGELATLELKRGKSYVYDLASLVYDIDNDDDPFLVVTPSESGATYYDLFTGLMTVEFEDLGEQTITITAQDKYDSNHYTINVNVYDSKPFVVSEDGTGYMTVALQDAYIGASPTATLMLTEAAPTFTQLESQWQMCEGATGVCLDLIIKPLDVTASDRGWTVALDFPSRPYGLQFDDDVKLSLVVGTDDAGEEYKMMAPMYWRIFDEAPGPADMTLDELTLHVADLEARIAELEAAIADGSANAGAASALDELQSDLSDACSDGRVACASDNVQSGGDTLDEGGMSMTLILIVVGVLVLAALLGLMFTRGGSGGEADVKWDETTLPAADLTANSMYGGAQEIFQQPMVAAPPMPAMPLAPAGPPLPPGGLPAGWTMEQWVHYGQQYLDQFQ